MFNSHFAANLVENLAVCVSEGYSVKLTIALKRRQTYMIYPHTCIKYSTNKYQYCYLYKGLKYKYRYSTNGPCTST